MFRRQAKAGYLSPERRVATQLSDSPAQKRLIHIVQYLPLILTFYYPNITHSIHIAPLGASFASTLEYPQPRSPENPSFPRFCSRECLLYYRPQQSLFPASDNTPGNMAVLPLDVSLSSFRRKARREYTS